ncbi:MAG: hypothetical protein OXF78_01550 [Rhodospirillales bacterium]|nr:hypothetical protein [Rhodospirillales bacterium]
MSHGTRRDGAGRSLVVSYLQAHRDAAQAWGPGFDGLPIHRVMPTVRLLEGTSEQDRQRLLRTLRVINTALPVGRNLQLDDTPVRLSELGACSAGGWFQEHPDGTILVEFGPLGQGQVSAAVLHPKAKYDGNDQLYLAGSHIQVDPDRIRTAFSISGADLEQAIAGQLVHELIHGLGFLKDFSDPNDPSWEWVTIMSYNDKGPDRVKEYGGKPGHVIYPLDREAVRAAYTRLARNATDIEGDLGPWSDTSTHVMGEITAVDVQFGATVRNGISYGWASGPAPSVSLADSATLTGSASWSGRFLGLTPQSAVVAGDADMTVELATLAGELDFSSLEAWTANAAPGAVGTGSTWGDGDLEYAISVQGNTFQSTGGDSGTVTGAFFGAAHEGMGGVLERRDLSGGFGGTR